jgi:hypothetical protein
MGGTKYIAKAKGLICPTGWQSPFSGGAGASKHPFDAKIACFEKLILPAVSKPSGVSPVYGRFFLFTKIGNYVFSPLIPPHPEGRYGQIVTKREAGCDGREGCVRRTQAVADGESVWSWPPDAGVKPCEDVSQE